jgi:hypothetical protein
VALNAEEDHCSRRVKEVNGDVLWGDAIRWSHIVVVEGVVHD